MISTDNDSAPLSGLYAIFSTKIPRIMQTTADITVAIYGLIPSEIIQVNAIYPPTMITSPCAKFSILAIP